MRWGWPSAEVRDRLEFVFKGVQAGAIVFGAIWGLVTYTITAAHQRDGIRRELRKPYDEKQLSLYLDAARVLAHLSATPDYEREKTEARFWELYWGELAFVESSRVASLMVAFCRKRFEPTKCNTPHPENVLEASTLEGAAIGMSHEASDEIRKRWEDK